MPTPLSALGSTEDQALSAPSINSALHGELAQRDLQTVLQMYKFAQRFAAMFADWRASAVVTNAVGMGHVPTYAPPMGITGPLTLPIVVRERRR